MSDRRPDVSWWQRLVQRVAATRTGARIAARTLPGVDLFLLRATGGRIALPRLLAGIPVVELTTTGAKTGKERTVPVVGLRDGDRWILVASNWGKDRHPAWYHNLRANPTVKLTHDGRTGRYVAREATGIERERYWSWAEELYVGFEAYRRRAGDRRVPVVVLEPAD